MRPNANVGYLSDSVDQSSSDFMGKRGYAGPSNKPGS